MAQVRTTIAVLLLGPLLGTAPLLAQKSVSIGAFVGYYLPLGRYDQGSGQVVAGLPQSPQDLRGPTAGADAEVWFGHGRGVAIDAAGTRSTIPVAQTPEWTAPSSRANIETLTAQALFALPRGLGNRTWASAGLGVVRHDGKGYAQYGSPTDPAVALGAGSSFDISHGLAFTVGVTSLWYDLNIPMPANLRANSGSLQSGLQLDMSLRIGATWAIWSAAG